MRSLKGAFAGGAKGLPVNIVKVAKNAASGAKNLIPKGMGMLGKGGGILTAGVGIFEALMSLLSGDSLGTALGKGAGPVLGTIIGTALLGPIGGIIGGMIGSMESITQPLGAAFESILGTLDTTFGLIVQVGKDLFGLIDIALQKMFGVNKSFSSLQFVITALLSPFRLLELMIIGLYEGYLRIKEKLPGGLSDEDKKKKNELFLQRMEKTASLELDFKQAYNKKARAEYQRELDFLKARGAGGEERARIVESALRQIDEKLKTKPTPSGTTPATPPKPPAKPGAPANKPWNPKDVDATIRALGGDPTKKPNLPTVVPTVKPKPGADPVRDKLRAQAGSDIGNLIKFLNPPLLSKPPGTGGTTSIPKDLQRTAQTPAAVKTGTDKTTTAVKELTAKITSQSSLQTSVAAIYNLMASGMLRVQTNMAGMMVQGAKGLPTPITGIGTGQIPGVENIQWGANQKTNIVDTKKLNTQGNRGASNNQIAINSPVTIYQQPGQNSDELASIVALKIGEAVADARAASVFV